MTETETDPMDKDKLYESRLEMFQFMSTHAAKQQLMYMTVVAILVSFPLTQLKSTLLFYVLNGLCLLFCIWAMNGTRIHLNFVTDFESKTE